jgi:hypothetical protein
VDEVEKLAAHVRRASKTGPARYVTGVTAASPAGGWVRVDRPDGHAVSARVPGSFRSTVTAGQQVRLSVQGDTHTLDAILEPLPTPTVTAAPAASTVSPLTMTDALGFSAAGFSNAGFTSQDFQCALYAEYVKDELNDAIDVINNHEDTIASLKATVNGLRTTVEALRSALRDQGHVA